VGAFLGAGGAAAVWAGTDLRPARGQAAPVAIKCLGGEAAASAAALLVRLAARAPHPQLLHPRAVFAEDNLWLVVMDRAVGSLAALVAARGTLPPPVAVGVGLQVCAALGALHAEGLAHRDIKPHNLLRGPGGVVWLADLAAAAGPGLPPPAERGTLPFMAPEQRRDPLAGGPPADLFALSVSLQWLMLGEVADEPWSEGARAQLSGAGAPGGLLDALAAAGAVRPGDRPDIGGFTALLGGCGVVPAPLSAEELPAAPAPAAPAPAAPWVRWAALSVGLATVSFALGRASAPTPPAADAPLPWCADAARGFAGAAAPGPRETLAVGGADLDADGLQDGIFVNQLAASLSVAWGEAGGGMGAPVELAVGRAAHAPAVVDLDEDGALDIIVGMPDDSAFAVLRGLGGRRFAPAGRVMQGPAPRELRVLRRPAGPALLFGAGGQLWERPLAPQLPWPGHRPLADYDTDSELVFVERPGEVWVLSYRRGQRELLRFDADLTLTARRPAPAWPPIIHAFSAALDGAPGEELYGVSEQGQGLRLPLDGPGACAMSPPGAMGHTSLLLHLDDDGLPDHLRAETCAGCTSRHLMERGQPG
jgi:hypothetical protein